MTPILTFGQRKQAMQGLPFYGKGDFNFIASRSNFTAGIAISVLPLSDMSRPQVIKVDDFETELKELNSVFKKGSRIGGIKVNSTFKNKNGKPDQIVGKFDSFKVDRKTKTIRAFILDPNTMKKVEVYPETLNRLTESKDYLAKTFLEFVI